MLYSILSIRVYEFARISLSRLWLVAFGLSQCFTIVDGAAYEQAGTEPLPVCLSGGGIGGGGVSSLFYLVST